MHPWPWEGWAPGSAPAFPPRKPSETRGLLTKASVSTTRQLWDLLLTDYRVLSLPRRTRPLRPFCPSKRLRTTAQPGLSPNQGDWCFAQLTSYTPEARQEAAGLDRPDPHVGLCGTRVLRGQAGGPRIWPCGPATALPSGV